MKRRLLKLALLLVVGAIINVAVAWACTLMIDPMSSDIEVLSQMGPEIPSGWFVARCRTSGSRVLMAMISGQSASEVTLHDARIPKSSRVRHLPAYEGEGPMPMWSDIAFGWPTVSMWYAVDAERDNKSGVVTSRTAKGCIGKVELPIRFLWPGFAINTIFYAAIVWLLFAAPKKIRRWRRIKRGLCRACAYPVGTNPRCTECGKPVQANIVGELL